MVLTLCIPLFQIKDIEEHSFAYFLLLMCNPRLHLHRHHHTHAPIHRQPRAWNQSQYSHVVHYSEWSVRPDRYHQSHDNNGGASRKGLILPETCPPHSMERGPVGLKVTLYHWEKSLRRGGETNLQSLVPIPPAPQLTSLLVFWRSEHVDVVTERRAFSGLLSPRNWLFSTFVTLKYAWQLPWCVALSCTTCTW